MIKLIGSFSKCIFKSSDSNYSIFSFYPLKSKSLDEEYSKLETKKNIFIINKNYKEIHLKKNFEVLIYKDENSKYEHTYILNELNEIKIDEKEVAISFLSSNFFKGININLANKIIENTDINFLEEPKNFEEKLITLIGLKKTDELIEQLSQRKIEKELYFSFSRESIGTTILWQLLQYYNAAELIEVLINDPFSLILNVNNINYFTIKNIASIYNKEISKEILLKNHILWIILYIARQEGSTKISIKYLYENYIKKEVEIDNVHYIELLKKLYNEKKIKIIDKINITSSYYFEKEQYILERLKKLSNTKIKEKEQKYEYSNFIDEEQKRAIDYSLENNIVIISGAPGTGKTTLVKEICKNFGNKQKSFSILAPTGKAAYQLSKKTNINAKTIHSFLEMNSKDSTFRINENNPSQKEILIIDEFSMVNIDILYSLLKGVPYLKKLIIIGDKDQLPSIGAGYILNDLIQTEKIKTFFLEKNYRQKDGSNIIKNAFFINNKKNPIYNNDDFVLVELDDNKIINYLKDEKFDWFKKQKWNQYQIICPTYIGEIGIDLINIEMQQYFAKQLNRNGANISSNKYIYEGDKVIQISNQNEHDVYNGEIGIIKRLLFDDKNKLDKIEIEFEGSKNVKYTKNEFSLFTNLAYAISVHKFQGSECETIFLIMSESHAFLNSKKLLYTAVTRAKKNIYILGSQKAIELSISSDNDSLRTSNTFDIVKNLH